MAKEQTPPDVPMVRAGIVHLTEPAYVDSYTLCSISTYRMVRMYHALNDPVTCLRCLGEKLINHPACCVVSVRENRSRVSHACISWKSADACGSGHRS